MFITHALARILAGLLLAVALAGCASRGHGPTEQPEPCVPPPQSAAPTLDERLAAVPLPALLGQAHRMKADGVPV